MPPYNNDKRERKKIRPVAIWAEVSAGVAEDDRQCLSVVVVVAHRAVLVGGPVDRNGFQWWKWVWGGATVFMALPPFNLGKALQKNRILSSIFLNGTYCLYTPLLLNGTAIKKKKLFLRLPLFSLNRSIFTFTTFGKDLKTVRLISTVTPLSGSASSPLPAR